MMTTIQNVNGSRSIVQTVSTPEGAATLDGGDAGLLPEPASVPLASDSMTALAALLIEANCKDRADQRQVQDAADGDALREEDQRAAQLMDKANQDQGQALASGIGDIAGGALLAGSGFLPDGAEDHGTSWRLAAEGGGKAMPGIGTIVAGGYKAEADRDDGRAVMAEARAQIAVHRQQNASSEAQAASDSIRKVQDLLESIQQTAAASRLAAASELRG
jgi:hypothetical protein